MGAVFGYNVIMSIFKKKIPKKVKLQIAVVSAILLSIVLLIAIDVYFEGPLTQLLSNRDEVVELIRSAKVLGPLVFILLYALQSVIAPIPGQVVGIVGGYIFGWWGVLWSMIGTAIGFYAVFMLSRKLGRPFAEKVVKKESLDRFDFLLNKRGGAVFFILFLIPGLPDDVVGYVAGLTNIPIKTLMWMAVLGRFPAVVANNYIGDGMGASNYWALVIALVASAIIAVLLYVKRDAWQAWMKKTFGDKDEGKKD